MNDFKRYLARNFEFARSIVLGIKNGRQEILKQSLKIDIKSVEAWRHPYEFSIDFCFASRSRRGANLMLMLNDAKMSHFFQYIDTHDF